jgi:hypothetical protein
VQALLGHDSIVLTADTYTSVVPRLAHRAAEATITLVLKASRDRARRLRGRERRKRRVATVPRMIVEDLRTDRRTRDTPRAHRRSTPASKIPTITGTCWSEPTERGCAARDSNPEPAG